MGQRGKQYLIVAFCTSGSVRSIAPNVTNVFKNATLQEVFETAAQINEELKVMEFEGTFWENSNF